MRRKVTAIGLIAVIALLGWHIARQVTEMIRDSWQRGALDESYVENEDLETRYEVETSGVELPQIDVRMVPVSDWLEDQWPRWRGPSGQGVVDGAGYVDQWSDTKHVLWKAKTPGPGKSSPIIAQGKVFITTAYERGRRRSMVCFRCSDGTQLWETFLPAELPVTTGDSQGGYANSTPCTDGMRLYAFLGSGGLLCVDFEGNQVWHCLLAVTEEGFGTACSPLLYENRVIVYADQSKDSFIGAFDTKSGQPVWRTARQGQRGFASPIAIRTDKRDLIVVSGQDGVSAYDPQTGAEVWTCSGNTSDAIPTPVVGQGLLFCSSGESGPTLAIHAGGRGEVIETHVVWRLSGGSPHVPSALLYGDYLYMVSDASRVARCYEAKSGQEMWRKRLGSRPGRFTASPVAVDQKVFFTNENGETFVLQAGSEFRLLHTNELNGTIYASPALAEGRWYFRTEESLICIGK